MILLNQNWNTDLFKTANGLNLGYFAILGQDKYASGPKLCILVCSKLLERVFSNKSFDVYVVCRFWRRAKICIQRNKAMISNFSPGFYIFQTLWDWAKSWDPTDDPWLGQPVGSLVNGLTSISWWIQDFQDLFAVSWTCPSGCFRRHIKHCRMTNLDKQIEFQI